VSSLFIFSVIVAFGSIYELAEFGSAIVLGKARGLSFLGVQGDIWDAQKDMLMQSIGAIIGLIALHLIR
jgi:putative membrane protein